MNLKDKVVVITGGSKGFGKALAKFFKLEGSVVVLGDRNQQTLEVVSSELAVDRFLIDTSVFEDVRRFGEYVFEKYGKVDVWINNAGVQIAPSLVEETDVKKLRDLFEVNFFGYFYGCKTAIFYMKKSGEGIIINVNSTAGLEGKPSISAYSSSKFAVKGLTESLRKELKDFNIRVLGVFPGGMKTEIYKEKYPEDFDSYMEVNEVAKKVVENLKAESPEVDLVIRRPS